MEIPHDFFLINPGNSTFFSTDPGIFTWYFFSLSQNSMFSNPSAPCLDFCWNSPLQYLSIYIYLSIFRYVYIYIIYIHMYEVLLVSFRTFLIWPLFFTRHTLNSSPLQSTLLWLQYTCCTVPPTSGRPPGSPPVWTYPRPSSQPLSSPQFFQNDCLWGFPWA